MCGALVQWKEGAEQKGREAVARASLSGTMVRCVLDSPLDALHLSHKCPLGLKCGSVPYRGVAFSLERLYVAHSYTGSYAGFAHSRHSIYIL